MSEERQTELPQGYNKREISTVDYDGQWYTARQMLSYARRMLNGAKQSEVKIAEPFGVADAEEKIKEILRQLENDHNQLVGGIEIELDRVATQMQDQAERFRRRVRITMLPRAGSQW